MLTEKQRIAADRKAAAELRKHPRVVTDPKILVWRKQEFVRLGFSMGEAQSLSVRGEADLHEIADWLRNGATHVQVLEILARDVEIVLVEIEDE